MAMNSSVATSAIVVLAVITPISEPTNSGVSVPARELSVPPVCTSWLPLLPPPPSMLSIGFTTVLSMHTQKPQMNAPSRYITKLRVTMSPPTENTLVSAPTIPESHCRNRPARPTTIAVRAVFL